MVADYWTIPRLLDDPQTTGRSPLFNEHTPEHDATRFSYPLHACMQRTGTDAFGDPCQQRHVRCHLPLALGSAADCRLCPRGVDLLLPVACNNQSVIIYTCTFPWALIPYN